MPDIEDFRKKLHSNVKEALTAYELDFNPVNFDTPGKGKKAYEIGIDWEFDNPNKIKMLRKPNSSKKITYLPWEPGVATSVTLDSSSPPYLITSHISNCRMTLKFHDGKGTSVTVIHVAGDVPDGGTVKGSAQRDVIEDTVKTPDVTRTRRLSTSYQKIGRLAGKHMEEKKANAGTTYYDSYARVFGVRGDNGGWSFYAQNINNKEQVIGFFDF